MDGSSFVWSRINIVIYTKTKIPIIRNCIENSQRLELGKAFELKRTTSFPDYETSTLIVLTYEDKTDRGALDQALLSLN